MKSRRALGYLLLFLIAYGATVEAVHGHGRVSQERPGAVAMSDAGESHSSDTGKTNHNECPTCQFQQQLFNGNAHVPLFALTPLTQLAFVSTLTVFCPSTIARRPSGRAPPLS